MICVYCVSHAPALMTLPLGRNGGARLLLFFLLVVQSSDVLQYIWGKLLGRHPIAPRVSPNKTWEGFVGGIGSATALGTALWWATPFNPWQAAGMSLVITLLGFGGRADHVGHQARPGSQGLRHADSGARRRAGPRGLHLLRRAGFFSPDPLLLHLNILAAAHD